MGANMKFDLVDIAGIIIAGTLVGAVYGSWTTVLYAQASVVVGMVILGWFRRAKQRRLERSAIRDLGRDCRRM